MRRDYESTDLAGAAHFADDDPDDDRYEDARLEQAEDRPWPLATRRCWDCGQATYCVCAAEDMGLVKEDGE